MQSVSSIPPITAGGASQWPHHHYPRSTRHLHGDSRDEDDSFTGALNADGTAAIQCKWESLRDQLLLQWDRITRQEIDQAGANRKNIAQLIAGKYNLTVTRIDNYLRNFERTLPMM